MRRRIYKLDKREIKNPYSPSNFPHLPPSAKIVRTQDDYFRNLLLCVFEDDSFEDIPDNCDLPEFEWDHKDEVYEKPETYSHVCVGCNGDSDIPLCYYCKSRLSGMQLLMTELGNIAKERYPDMEFMDDSSSPDTALDLLYIIHKMKKELD